MSGSARKSRQVVSKMYCSNEVFNLLYRLGVTANYIGFFQTAYAVQLCVQHPERLTLVTKWVYLDVAKHFNTNWKAVERNIRTVCNIIWTEERGSLESISKKPLTKKPCASQLLSILSHTLLSQNNVIG